MPQPERDLPDLHRVASVLADKQQELETQIDLITRPVQDQGSISFGKRVGDGTAMAVDRLTSVRAHEQLTSLLADVRRARAALADGTYGTCEVCGDAIAPGRLEARPWSTRCLRHS